MTIDAVRRATGVESRGEVMEPVTLLRLSEVCRRPGLARATVYRLMERGRFPRSCKLTDYSVAWSSLEVQAWIEHRLAIPSGRGPAPGDAVA